MEKERTSKEIIVENSLSSYEMAVFAGLEKSKGSKAVHAKAISEALDNVLNAKAIDENGESELTVAETLVIKTISDAIENPGTGKLKDLATIVGDVAATKVEITKSSVDDELARSAIGEDEDGEE